ncbi:MAG: DJ-1/PfpI family protein [Hyphomicrobiaceae bacterium]|nr:DJ-1/PfpI family protein [Hyphomicrobiaceae bacterium]MCC0023782.1 DJ-1/PfpI family protein [Hyphomicrobiaceae bacterium]
MTKIAVFLTDRFADWECALLMAAARTYYGMDVLTVSTNGQKVTSAGGLQIIPDLALDQVSAQKPDAFIMAGGSVWSTDEAPDMDDALKALAAGKVLIGAICDANLALAATGLINDVPHTANAPEALSGVGDYDGEKNYVASPAAIRADGFVTAPGTAPISFMREVLIALGRDEKELGFYTGLYANEHQKAA